MVLLAAVRGMVVMVAAGRQCACGATHGWWRDRVACGDYMLLRFLPCGRFWRLRRYILLVAACLLWGDNAPAALHKAVGKPMAPARGAYIFLCFLLFVFCFPAMSMFSCCRFGFRPRGQLPPRGAGFSGWARPLAWSDFPDGTAGRLTALCYRFLRLWLARLFSFLPFWCSGR